MRILYLAPSEGGTGSLTSHTFLDEEIRAFQAAGVTAYLLSTAVDRDCEIDGVRVFAIPPLTAAERAGSVAFLLRRATSLAFRRLRRLREFAYLARLERLAAERARRERIDVLHSIFGWPGGFGGVLARAAARIPLIANFRGADLLMDPASGYGMRGDPDWDARVRLPLRGADRTLYATDFMRARGVELGADAAKAVTIPKGVDLERFVPAPDRHRLAARLGFSRPVILTVCNLIRRKGVHHILEALAQLPDAPPFELVICGEGPERPALESQSARLGLTDRVRFAGWVGRSEIPRYFAACEVFVLASAVEAAGNVVLEAMASARPVICTDSGGPPEYVRDGESGFVVPVGDAAALRDRIGRLLREPLLADALGRNGRAAAEARYPYGRMVREVLQLYQTTAAQPARAAVATVRAASGSTANG